MRTRTPGRKRDPRVDEAVQEAALRLFATRGWLGFTFEAISREAKVGKPALHRRWSGREALLSDALRMMSFPKPRELGSLREELHDLAHQLADWWLDGSGQIGLRLVLESPIYPELQAVYDEVMRGPGADAGLVLVAPAIERGELRPDTDRYLVAELIAGAMMTRYIYTVYRAGGSAEAFHAYADQLADELARLLSAAAAGPRRSRRAARARRAR